MGAFKTIRCPGCGASLKLSFGAAMCSIILVQFIVLLGGVVAISPFIGVRFSLEQAAWVFPLLFLVGGIAAYPIAAYIHYKLVPLVEKKA